MTEEVYIVKIEIKNFLLIDKGIMTLTDLFRNYDPFSFVSDDSCLEYIYMSHFAYACKTEGKNDISHLISETA